MKRRNTSNQFTRFCLLSALTVCVFFSITLFPPKALALGDVTLSATFHDDDAEDTHEASQWVIRDGDGGVFDSGTDTVNKTTITVDASYFSLGTTYYWKVRFQDNHESWSAYSAEQEFIYGSLPTPTPTPTPTVEPTSTASPTATPTSTATATVTTTATDSPPITTSNTAVPAVGGILNAQIIYPNGNEIFSLGDYINIRYKLGIDAGLSVAGSSICQEKVKDYSQDLYISTDSYSYTRIASDLNYIEDCTYLNFKDSLHYIEVTYSWRIPDDQRLITEDARVAVVLHRTDNSGVYSLGSGFKSGSNWRFADSYFFASDSSDNPFAIRAQSTIEQSINSIILTKPDGSRDYYVGADGEVRWHTEFTDLDQIEKVNIYLSLDGGKNYNIQLASNEENDGLFDFKILQEYQTRRAKIMIEGVSGEGEIIDTDESKIFRILSIAPFGGCIDGPCVCIGPNCYEGGEINDTLILGSVATVVIPFLLVVIASLPVLSRTLGFVGPLLQGLLGGLLSRFTFFSRLGLLTQMPIFFPPVKKGKKSWGIVYDSLTKKPVSNAILKIFSKESGRLRDVKYSNAGGEFAMIVPRGEYRIVVSKAGYVFPSSVVVSKNDGRYENVYDGGSFEIESSRDDEQAPIEISIPIDPSGFTWYELVFAASRSFAGRFLAFVRYPLMFFGFALSIYLVIYEGTFLQYLILFIYIIFIVADLKALFKKRRFGIVLDQKGKPLSRAIVRVLNSGGKVKATIVTGEDGKFVANLNPGEYSFIAACNGFATGRKINVKVTSLNDLGGVVIKLVRASNVRLQN